MGDEKNSLPPTSSDSTKPQYNLATNNRGKATTAGKKPMFESGEIAAGIEHNEPKIPSPKKEGE